jgi:hypothetical protein
MIEKIINTILKMLDPAYQMTIFEVKHIDNKAPEILDKERKGPETKLLNFGRSFTLKGNHKSSLAGLKRAKETALYNARASTNDMTD